MQERLEAERRGFPFLVYRDGEGRQVVVALESERLTIGRRSANDVALSWDPGGPRLHAALEHIGAEWVLCDEGLSHNGTGSTARASRAGTACGRGTCSPSVRR